MQSIALINDNLACRVSKRLLKVNKSLHTVLFEPPPACVGGAVLFEPPPACVGGAVLFEPPPACVGGAVLFEPPPACVGGAVW